MSVMLSCAVWCEIHGPTIIFCTQTLDSSPPLLPPSTCASCSITLPDHLTTPGTSPLLRTADEGVLYVSSRHPTNQERYKALRSAVIRALSCESVPSRTGPVFFGDPVIGYTIAYIFRIGLRTFALLCTATQERDLLQSWTFVTERFRVIVQKLRDHVVEVPPERSFLRPMGRVGEKGLAEVLQMPDVFVQLHASFSWILRVWRLHYEDQGVTVE